jgi:hypothetical protein
MAYVYRHIRLDKNEPFYIGIGSDDNGKYTRANSMLDRNRHWHNIVKNTSYEVQIIVDNISWEDAIEKEKEFISLYGRKSNGGILCNLTNGGDGVLGMIHSESTKKKMSESRKGKCFISKEKYARLAEFHRGRKRPKETGDKISAIKKGKKMGKDNPFYRKKHSEESIKKMSESQKGEKHWAYGKRGPYCHSFGRKASDETKAKMSEDRRNEKNSFFGKKHTDESINKIKKSRGFPNVLKISLEGEIISEYLSLNRAEKDNIGAYRHGISDACVSGIVFKGFYWKYKTT